MMTRARVTITAVATSVAAFTAVAMGGGSTASALARHSVNGPSDGVIPLYERSIGLPGQPTIGPSGIDVDRSGRLYVADTANSQVAAYDSSGNQIWRRGVLGATGPGNFSNPRDVAVDSAREYLFVADTTFSRVQMLNAATGAPMSVWNTHFQAAMGISVGVGPSGGTIVLVADATNNRIDLFTESGGPIRTIGTSSGPGKLGQPRDAATDSHGNIYVADFKNNRVVEFSPVGAYLRQWGGWAATTTPPPPGKFRDPYGVALDDAGHVYVSDNLRIQEFTAAGAYLQSYGSAGTGPGRFFQLRRVAVGHGTAPYIYGADLWGYKVLRFNPVGSLSLQYGDGLTPPVGTLDQPYGLTMGPTGVYFTDTDNQRVQEFDPTAGTPITSFGHRGFGSDLLGVNWPRDVAYDAVTGTLWVADTKNFRLLEFNQDGTSTKHHLGSQGAGVGQLNWVFALAAYGGDLVVADTFNNRIQLWDPTHPTSPVVWTAIGFNRPKAVAVAGSQIYVADSGNNQVVVLDASTGAVKQKLAAGQIGDPEGIAVTPLGNIWVSSTTNSQILELDPTGAVIETYGSLGAVTGQFNHPSHLVFVVAGSNEELYVMDTDNDRCQVFSVTGS